MSVIVVALEHILSDADHPVDLSALPEHEAVERIKDLYGFIRSAVEVTIENGVATITIADEKTQQANQALRTLEQASRLAKQGKVARAIPLFQEVLRVLPEHTEARRELAMALMETGSAAAAKKHLIRVLQLDPGNAWAYLSLGNLYLQHEQDLGSADRYFTSALDLAPDDPYILNSAASLKAKRGDYATAESMFVHAIEREPSFPNPRYGLALSYSHQGRLEEALGVLEQIFSQPDSGDPRHAPVYTEARRLYLDIRRRRAVELHEDNLAELRQVMDAYTSRTGIPIELQRDDSLTTPAKVELAWRYGRGSHNIKHKDLPRATHVYLLAHEFEHILLEEQSRAAGRSRAFASNTARKQQIERSLDKDLRRLRNRRGFPAHAIEDYVAFVIDGQINQLYNMPLDLVIDSRIHDAYPFLHDSQIAFIAGEQEQNQRLLTDRQMREMAPARIYQANLALNAVQALLLVEFSEGATAYAAPYRPAGVLPTAQRLFAFWRQTMADFQPGDERDLVDAFARELKMEDWYTWVDEVSSASRGPQVADVPPGGGSTNLELLADPSLQMAATMYMLGALKRFADMDPITIRQIASEIALVGMNGLDYASSEQKYTLRFLPSEQFSGLQLMCLMYVAFKKVDPAVDTGIRLDRAYQEALQMYEMGM